MKKLKIILVSAVILLLPYACSKKGNNSAKPLLEKDPSVHESFGLKINFSAFGLPKFRGNVWGSASKFFISTESDILKVDFVSNSLINIAPQTGGIVTGLSGDKIIFVGTTSNNLGYYSYSVSASGPVTPVLSLNKSEATGLLVYDNHMLLSTGIVVTTGRPCTSLWDFWCGVGQSVQNLTLYHIEGTTRASTLIGSSQNALLFSGNGQKALIKSSIKYYIYDLNLLQKTDSFTYNNERRFFWGNNDPLSVHIDLNGDVVIANAITNTETDRFQTSALILPSDILNILWGSTGRKIYYTGPCRTVACSYAIWSFNLDSREEKQHIFTTTAGGTSPFEEIQVSPDDHNLIFRHINSLYFKAL